ncbi:MAG: hypothetical protein DRJ18_01445 [Candidatus Methanomethylicota archaeon]|nr:MAG: hypothetical protein DRJ18_01445 [Candidatus Verstraetearchaeota archaeon]
MRVDEEIRQELIKNLKDRLALFNNFNTRIIRRMAKVQSVEKLMKLKKELLLWWIRFIPLGLGHCYFCLKDKLNESYSSLRCSNCEYARIHGKCTEDSSDYMKIVKTLERLEKKIEKLYFKRGERYT